MRFGSFGGFGGPGGLPLLRGGSTPEGRPFERLGDSCLSVMRYGLLLCGGHTFRFLIHLFLG